MQELIITGGTLVTMDPQDTVIPDGALLIQGERITYCGPREGLPRAKAAEVLEANGGLILPGLINSHTHAAMTLMRGMADDVPLEPWLNEHIFPAERNLTPEAVYWGSLLACAEMIKNGITSICDMYLFAEQVARAVDQAGMRAVVGEAVYDFPSPSYGELEQGFAWTEELIRRYRDHPRISAAVMPHAPYTCSPPLLERAGQISQDLEADLNIHLAETPSETAAMLERYGKRPLAYLAGLGLLNHRLWANHGVELNREEIGQMAAAGARLTLCPESNMKLGSGVAPLKDLLEAGVKLALGTDGAASNDDLDLLGEMDTAAKVHKVMGKRPSAAPAKLILSLATSRGAAAWGRDDLGVLTEGALADVMVLDTRRPHLVPAYNPYSQLVYAARGSDVIHTLCHGRVLMQDRRLLTLDEQEVMAKAREQAATLGRRA